MPATYFSVFLCWNMSLTCKGLKTIAVKFLKVYINIYGACPNLSYYWKNFVHVWEELLGTCIDKTYLHKSSSSIINHSTHSFIAYNKHCMIKPLYDCWNKLEISFIYFAHNPSPWQYQELVGLLGYHWFGKKSSHSFTL